MEAEQGWSHISVISPNYNFLNEPDDMPHKYLNEDLTVGCVFVPFEVSCEILRARMREDFELINRLLIPYIVRTLDYYVFRTNKNKKPL